jgi:hypothetical protein
MSRTKADPIQKLKDTIIQLPAEAMEKLYLWLQAVRDVNIENARREAAKKKEGSTT